MVQGSSGMGSGRGSMTWLRHQFSIVPGIAGRATRLDLRIGRIGNQLPIRMATSEGPVDMLADPTWIEGPWEFEVPLRG